METEIFKEYDYLLPSELVAHEPAVVRDHARLFVYDTQTDTIAFDIFKNVALYLPKQSVMVLNDTKVVPARLFGNITRGRATQHIELLMLANEPCSHPHGMYALTHNRVAVGRTIYFGSDAVCTVVGKERERLILTCSMDFETLLERHGKTPTPPYIEAHIPEEELRKRYQTVYARKGASVAAPTASLHFTEEVFRSLKEKHIDKYCATLEVGMGTFAPVWDEHIQSGTLHSEWYTIPKDTVHAVVTAKNYARPVIAVGTTVVRMLESAANELDMTVDATKDVSGSTQLFIRPGYQFSTVDHLITNFHVPRSSLMSLVDAFLVHKGSKKRILELYSEAIKAKYRFYSFGDSMLIL